MMLLAFLNMMMTTVTARGLTVEPYIPSSSISLYSGTDVIDLFDTNTSSLYSSETLWIVQFYSHWCGHCQRFAPYWISLAEDIKDWAPKVHVAAINCAEQSCDRYQIRGTPTIRIFHPLTQPNRLDSSYYGFEVPVKHDIEFFKGTLLYNVQNVQKSIDKVWGRKLKLSALGTIPQPTKESLAAMFTGLPETVDYIAIVFEQEYINSVGKEVIMDMNKYVDILPVYRAESGLARAMDWRIVQGGKPVLVVVDREGNQVDQVLGWGMVIQDRRRFRSILYSYVEGQYGSTESPEPSVAQPQTEVPVTTAVSHISPSVERRDMVYLGDLEKAVEYSLTREVAMQPVLGMQKLNILVYYIEVLINYLPGLREPIRKFLVSLRDWPVQMGYTSVTHTQYKNKVAELLELHRPFLATPTQWEGCSGSEEQYRGYPCSLWTLFHALTVNAETKDPAFVYGGVSTVANCMIGYVAQFFSCRDCAHHFSSHVSSLGFLPTTGDQSIIWLWTIHNKANFMLSGDPTEDPAFPKIQWPSPSNCPNCRRTEERWTHRGVNHAPYGWNQEVVLNYIKTIYSEDNITNNTLEEISNRELIIEALEELRSVGSDHWSEEAFTETKEKMLQICVKH